MTSPVMDDPVGYCVATAVRDCFCARLAAVSAPVGCCCLMPGQQVAWDSCDPGMAWVRLAQVYQVGHQFPQRATPAEISACGGGGGWAVVLELGALRCLPQPDGTQLPSCGDYDAVTRLVYADAQAMREALFCCDWRTGCNLNEPQWFAGDWLPVGPQGACVGGVMTVTIEVQACICPEDEPGV